MTKEQKGRGGLADPLCSRNARPQKALVGRAQLGISHTTPLEESTKTNLPCASLPSEALLRKLGEVRGGERMKWSDGLVESLNPFRIANS